MFIVSQNLV